MLIRPINVPRPRLIARRILVAGRGARNSDSAPNVHEGLVVFCAPACDRIVAHRLVVKRRDHRWKDGSTP
jgi:hypothetical protein